MLGMNDFKKGSGGPQDKEIIWDPTARTLMIFNAFFIVWLLILINDTKKYIAMVSAATYYFSCTETSPEGSASVMTGFSFAYFKNLGSLCFGSLVVTLISILRATVDALAEGGKDDSNGAAKCIACIA